MKTQGGAVNAGWKDGAGSRYPPAAIRKTGRPSKLS
jgi:hypothetical protein